MKFLLTTVDYAPSKGGVAHYYEHLVKYSPEPFFVLANGQEIDEKNVNYRLLINDFLPFFKWLPAIFHIFYFTKKTDADVIIAGNILPLGLPCYLVAKALNRRFAIILHGFDYGITRRHPRKSKLADWLIGKADEVICANTYTADLVKANATLRTSSRVGIVNPGIDAKEPFIDEQAIALLKDDYHLHGKKVFLYVGRLVKRKGTDVLIEAMKIIKETRQDFFLVIIGSGSEECSIRESIKKNNLDDSVLLLTEVENNERRLWQHLADVFIMTPREIDGDFEGFGIVYLEAGLACKPVIASNTGGVSDAVVNNLNGLIVDPEMPHEIALSMIKLADHPGLCAKLGEEGRKRALSDFDWRVLAAKFVEYFK